jgi:hypothetical protein
LLPGSADATALRTPTLAAAAAIAQSERLILCARRCDVTSEISARIVFENSLPTREQPADLARRELHPKEMRFRIARANGPRAGLGWRSSQWPLGRRLREGLIRRPVGGCVRAEGGPTGSKGRPGLRRRHNGRSRVSRSPAACKPCGPLVPQVSHAASRNVTHTNGLNSACLFQSQPASLSAVLVGRTSPKSRSAPPPRWCALRGFGIRCWSA